MTAGHSYLPCSLSWSLSLSRAFVSPFTVDAHTQQCPEGQQIQERSIACSSHCSEREKDKKRLTSKYSLLYSHINSRALRLTPLLGMVMKIELDPSH